INLRGCCGSPLMEIGTSPTPNTYSMLNCPGANESAPSPFTVSSSSENVSCVSRCARRMRYGFGVIGSNGVGMCKSFSRAHAIDIQQLQARGLQPLGNHQRELFHKRVT